MRAFIGLLRDRFGVPYPLADRRPFAVIHKRQRAACPISSPGARDVDWIPEVTRRGWVILTRDRHIQERPLELAAVREHGARLVALTSEEARSVFDQLEVVMCRWRDIESTPELPAPFIYAATRTTLRPIPLG